MGDTASATKDPTTVARWDGILGRWLRVGRMTCSFLRAGLRGIGAISRLWWVDLQWQRTQTDNSMSGSARQMLVHQWPISGRGFQVLDA